MKNTPAIKIIAAFFILCAITTMFVACKNNEEETTTTFPLTAAPATTTTQPASVEEQGLTYILTTQQGQTVPWSETTRFEIAAANAPSTTEFNTNFSIPSGDITPPDVQTSILPTAASSTTSPTTLKFSTVSENISTSAKPTTAKPTTKATTATTQSTTVKKVAKEIVPNDVGYNMNTGDIIIGVDMTGWSSDFVANTQYIEVSVDGSPIGTAKCTVSSKKNADGNSVITIDLSDKGLNEGSTVSFTIPQGFIQTKAKNQYSTSYSTSVNTDSTF